MAKIQGNTFEWNETIQKLFEMDKNAVDNETEKFTSNRIENIVPDEDFREIVDCAADSVTTSEILCGGEVIEDNGEYEHYYSDCAGGEFIQLKLVRYKGKLYVYKEKVIEDRKLKQKRECISFYELK